MRAYIARHYGSRRGLVRHVAALGRYWVGGLRRYRKVDWSRVERLVFVCKGNICRSPYAEHRARAAGLAAISFGLEAGVALAANEVAVALAGEGMLDLGGHRTRQPGDVQISPGDLLIGMEPEHGELLLPLAVAAGAQVTLLGLWRAPARPHIEDPFGLPAEYHRRCQRVIDDAIANIAQICRRHRSPAALGGRTRAWYEAHPVLVVDAGSLGLLGVVRSLGQAGYPVHAVSADADAYSLQSNFATKAVIGPPCEDASFLPWVRDYVARHGIQAIVPSEGLLLAVRPAFAEFTRLLPYSPSPDVVYRGLSKSDVYEALMRGGHGDHMPPTLLLRATDPLPSVADLRNLGEPLFLKVDECYCHEGEGGRVYKAASAEEALVRLATLHRGYDKVLIQGFVPGRGMGVFFLWWKGRLLAEFMHRRLHEVPHTGGVSSLRESCFQQAIHDDALAKLRCLDWEGVAMMEYRLDEQTGEFYFMEMNGRFWGSLHLALHAGVDFPALLVDALLDAPPQPVLQYPLGLRCRYTFPRDVQYVWSCLKDRELPLHRRFWPIAEFFLLALNPKIYSDLFFPGDRKLYWRSMKEFLKGALTAPLRWLHR